jgi:dTDP-4-dehydrorhamnose reductase
MKVLIAGATGVIGRQLVPKLIAAGHEVAGTTRTPSKEPALREAGATPFVVDVLDPDAVASAVASFEPEVIVHEAWGRAGDLERPALPDVSWPGASVSVLKTAGLCRRGMVSYIRIYARRQSGGSLLTRPAVS